MRNEHKSPVLAPRSRTVLTAIGALGVLLGLAGCPAQGGCPPCYVGDVMADASSSSTNPSSALYVQLDSTDSGKKVSSIELTIKSADGKVETHTYSGEQVAKVSSGSLMAIPDPELFDVDGSPPAAKAKIVINFAGGGSTSDSEVEVYPVGKGPARIDKPIDEDRKIETEVKPEEAPKTIDAEVQPVTEEAATEGDAAAEAK